MIQGSKREAWWKIKGIRETLTQMKRQSYDVIYKLKVITQKDKDL